MAGAGVQTVHGGATGTGRLGPRMSVIACRERAGRPEIEEFGKVNDLKPSAEQRKEAWHFWVGIAICLPTACSAGSVGIQEGRPAIPSSTQAHPENRRSWEMAENFVFLFRKFVTGTDTSEILFEGVVE